MKKLQDVAHAQSTGNETPRASASIQGSPLASPRLGSPTPGGLLITRSLSGNIIPEAGFKSPRSVGSGAYDSQGNPIPDENAQRDAERGFAVSEEREKDIQVRCSIYNTPMCLRAPPAIAVVFCSSLGDHVMWLNRISKTKSLSTVSK